MHILFYTICCWTQEFYRSQSHFLDTNCNLSPGSLSHYMQGNEDHYREPRFTSKEVYEYPILSQEKNNNTL